jgi:FkbH-like protein
MYKDEQKRDLSLRERKMISLDDWLYTLKIKVHVERLNNNNIHRASQLFNKTNQMNLSTRRMSETELNKWVNNPQHYLWVFRVSDKFGKSGITGIGSLEIDNKKNTAIITDFILSCRVMGRNIEKVVVYHLINQAKSFGCSKVLAKYKFSKKNAPCFEFWQYSKFKQHDNNTFVWNLKDKYLMPESVNLVVV